MMSNRWPYSLVLSGALVACGGGAQTPDADAPPPAGAPRTGVPSKSAQPGGTGPTTDNVRTSDIDEDGRPEVTKYYDDVPDPERPGQRKSVLVRQELDLTWDGRVDIWRYFGPDGKVTKEEWDLDYDGNVDETRFFEEGVLVRTERDQNNDGQIDVTRYYADGKLERKETDSNGDGKPDRWEYYEGRVLDRVGVDKDFDGTVDTWAKAATQRS
jgi:hypothetical protein